MRRYRRAFLGILCVFALLGSAQANDLSSYINIANDYGLCIARDMVDERIAEKSDIRVTSIAGTGAPQTGASFIVVLIDE